MAISITNREVEALLDEIRTMTGKDITEIVLDLARQEAEEADSETAAQSTFVPSSAIL